MSNPPGNVLFVPDIPAGVPLNGFTCLWAGDTRQQDRFLRRLPGMVSDGLINLGAAELVNALALEGVTSPIGKYHVDVHAFLGVPLAADGVHRRLGIEAFQKKLAKPLEALGI
jgi:hypothetical protein